MFPTRYYASRRNSTPNYRYVTICALYIPIILFPFIRATIGIHSTFAVSSRVVRTGRYSIFVLHCHSYSTTLHSFIVDRYYRFPHSVLLFRTVTTGAYIPSTFDSDYDRTLFRLTLFVAL